MKNLIYTLVTLAMLYYGLQQITLSGDQLQTVFAMSWLCLAIFVIGGNFAYYLYRPKKQVQAKQIKSYKTKRTYARQRLK
ncbi:MULTISPECIES: hypothetical protein [Metabacillus]|uniref:Uncharacterized protein n=2 Tax=Metabacillus TaxID=2675233 RepID=A0A179T8T3_9BACI|nr:MULTISPECIES: hypothetical protein [Metabacillus]OAS88792.1 hypothetical protein A6K24_15185 [Metabacillus litoralis]QNF26485.1 hypothetical protein HUW50_02265 [Metabacillus sp. KUDC1714]